MLFTARTARAFVTIVTCCLVLRRQDHPGIQALAIKSLSAYASNSTALIIVAPKCKHADLPDTTCSLASYKSRMWCRAEQVCFALRNGITNMYLTSDDKIENVDSEWFESVLGVFAGETTCCSRKHAGMSACDRQSLVVPVLGLYGELLSSSNQSENKCMKVFLDAIAVDRDRFFPREFVFIRDKGQPPVTMELFGDLAEMMETRVAETSILGTASFRARRASLVTFHAQSKSFAASLHAVQTPSTKGSSAACVVAPSSAMNAV